MAQTEYKARAEPGSSTEIRNDARRNRITSSIHLPKIDRLFIVTKFYDLERRELPECSL
ncbi:MULTISPECIES: hypothetical protein [unclassified Neorhizobium]|uniref:hypothetical protein n=1 Tax=unclassified Neorhizobium TaxID=2629175 RepID=UPI001FF65E7C|nr:MULTISPECIES: hypothetical protein [unclassified Neorhizobium]MCJ9673465.1 hypothetical protein [Neorhizobium sp. SHOUNA12B]MCJ9748734.1 hypothetical protein [Neorhizobium sp. SHOUNA12A]